MNYMNPYYFSLEWLIPKQFLSIKDSIIDIYNRLNKVFPLLFPFNWEFSLGNRIDVFPKHFSFHSLNRNCESSIKSPLHKLKDITF